MSEELKPCPFCGSSKLRLDSGKRGLRDEPYFYMEISCECGLCLRVCGEKDKLPSRLIQKWNTRAKTEGEK